MVFPSCRRSNTFRAPKGKTVNGWRSGETHFSMSAEGAKDDSSHFNLSGKRTECGDCACL